MLVTFTAKTDDYCTFIVGAIDTVQYISDTITLEIGHETDQIPEILFPFEISYYEPIDLDNQVNGYSKEDVEKSEKFYQEFDLGQLQISPVFCLEITSYCIEELLVIIPTWLQESDQKLRLMNTITSSQCT